MKRIKIIKIAVYTYCFGLIICLYSCSRSKINITLLHEPQSPLISLHFVWDIGSIHDPGEKEGITTLTALNIINGSTENYVYDELQKKLSAISTNINIQTTKETTTFFGNAPKEYLHIFYEIFSELLLHPRFNDNDFKRNKDILLNNINDTFHGKNDRNLCDEALNNFIYKKHPYGRINTGTAKSLSNITHSDVKDYYKRMFIQGNLEIGLAGSFTQEFVEQIKDDFSNLPLGETGDIHLPELELIENMEVLIIEKENTGTTLAFGFPITIKQSDPDFYALMIANTYLGGYGIFNGRLFKSMSELRGINDGAYSYIGDQFENNPGKSLLPLMPLRQRCFRVKLRPVQHMNALFSLRLAVYELEQLVEEGIGPEHFEAVRDSLIQHSKLWVQTQTQRLGYTMNSKFYDMEYFPDHIENVLNKLTIDEVNTAIRRYLQYQNIKVVIVTSDAKMIRDALNTNQTTPATYKNREDIPPKILEDDAIIETYELPINKERSETIPVEVFQLSIH